MTVSFSQIEAAENQFRLAAEQLERARDDEASPVPSLAVLPRDLDHRLSQAELMVDAIPTQLEHAIAAAKSSLLSPPDWTLKAVVRLGVPRVPAQSATTHLSQDEIRRAVGIAAHQSMLSVCEQLEAAAASEWRSATEFSMLKQIAASFQNRTAAIARVDSAAQMLRAGTHPWARLEQLAESCRSVGVAADFVQDYQRYRRLGTDISQLAARIAPTPIRPTSRLARHMALFIGAIFGGGVIAILAFNEQLRTALANDLPVLQPTLGDIAAHSTTGRWTLVVVAATCTALLTISLLFLSKFAISIATHCANRLRWMGSYQLRGSILAQIQDIHEHRIRLPVTQLLGRALRPKGLPDSDDILNTSAAVLFAESLQQYSHERAELLPLVQGDSSTAPDVLALSTSVDRRRDERAIELLRPLVAEALRLNQLELEGLLAQGARIRADNQARLKALREEVALERTAHSKRIEAARKDRVMSCSAQLKQCATSLTALYDRAGGKRAFARPVGLPSTFPSVPARQIQIGLQAPEARPWLGEHQTRSPLRPACIPVTEWRAVLVDPELPSEDRGALVLDIAMPLVLDNPPGDVRVLVIDSDSELSALAPLCLLLRDVRALRAPATSGIASTLDEVEHALRGLRAELNERLMYSLGGHRTLEDAIGAGATSAPRFVVIVLSTPRHLSGDAASVLASLADPSKGGRAGFHLIWAAATSLVQDAGLNNTHQSFIGRFCRLSALSSELGRWQDARSGQTLDFTREPISTWSTVARSSRRYSDAVLARANVGQTFADLISAFKKLEGEGMTSSRDVLDVPVGFDAHGDAVVLRIGAGTSHHGLIVGSAGAGKSRLLQVYVLAAALLYPPAELELALIDCKGADDGFKHFADAPGLPHARVVALGADREFACATLKHYLSVMRSRHRNARADSRQPGDSRRVVIILDEYQMLFAAEDRIAEEARACIAHLVRQGRSARINLILCSQSTEGMAHLPSEILNELGVRLALRCSQRDCERLFGDALAGSAITMDQRQGLLAGGPSEQSRDPRLFVTAVIDAERDITPRVQAFCRDEGRRPVVFTGDGLANPSELRHLLQQQSALPRLVVGRSLGLEGLASIEWVPERKWNLLAVSPPRNDMADRVAASCLYSIARLRGGADVHWLSGSRRGGGAAHFLQPAIRAAGAREWPAADLPAVLRQLVTTIQQRESTARGGVERPAFLVLHQIDALEVLDERDFEADRAASNAFSEILSKGPGVGVHVLATASSMARCCEMLGAKTAHFGHRVCTRLPFDDTGDLFATDVIRNLRDERCASFSAHLPGDHVVFIPFDF